MPPQNLPTALERWSTLLSPDQLQTDEADRAEWGQRTFGEPVAVSAILRPDSVEQLAECLRIASASRVPVHPVSRGANWGMGSRTPTVDGAVMLDLSALNAISGFDGERGLVHVQPGVSFTQLAQYLADKPCRYFLPTIGGPVTASVLANALDRGDGIMAGRWEGLGDLDVLLPDGRLLHTGYSGVDAHALRGLSPSLTGPLVEGLFSQSGFGVVVGGWIRLEPTPVNLSGFNLPIGPGEKLPAFIALWREMERDGLVAPRGTTLWNGIKFLARSHTRAELPPEQLDSAGDYWLISGLLRGESEAVLEARKQDLAERLAPWRGSLEQFDFRRRDQWLPGFEGFLGTPNEQNVRSAYWRKSKIPPAGRMNPDRDNCGLIWLCLALPFDGEALREYCVQARTVLAERGLDLNIGVEAADSRLLLSYIVIGYDREQPGADDLALDAYRLLLELGVSLGYAPYRLANGLPVPEALRIERDDYLAELRRVGDPAGILSPRRGRFSD